VSVGEENLEEEDDGDRYVMSNSEIMILAPDALIPNVVVLYVELQARMDRPRRCCNSSDGGEARYQKLGTDCR
jgi:hypothetical protein